MGEPETVMGIDARIALVFALTGGILAGCAGPVPQTTAEAPSAPRRIALYNTDNGERLSVVYRNNGEYDQAALSAVSNFMRDRRSGEIDPVDPALVDLLADIIAKLNLPDSTEVHITSGYRSPASNAILARTNGNVADDSYHMRGKAVDMRIPGVPLTKVVQVAADLQRGGYGLYVTHVHVDTGPVRTWGRRPDGSENDGTLEARAKARAEQTATRLASATPAPKGKEPVIARAGGKATHKPGSVMLAKATPKPNLKPGIILARNDVPDSKFLRAKPKAVTPPQRKR